MLFLLKEPFNANFQFYQIIRLKKSCFLCKPRTAWLRSVSSETWELQWWNAPLSQAAESPGSLLPRAVLCSESRVSGRVNTSSVVPQGPGEVDGTKGGNNLPFGAFEACVGRTLQRRLMLNFFLIHLILWTNSSSGDGEMGGGKTCFFLQLIKKGNH